MRREEGTTGVDNDFATHDVLLKGAGRNEPAVQLLATAAQRLLTALIEPGPEAIGRHTEGVHAKFGLQTSPPDG
jgi:hypothetical protein